jgi:hypothetical protein
MLSRVPMPFQPSVQRIQMKVPDLHWQRGAEKSECVEMCAHARRRDYTSTMRISRHTRSTQKYTRGLSFICTPLRRWWRVCALKPWPAPVTSLPCLDVCVCAVSVDIQIGLVHWFTSAHKLTNVLTSCVFISTTTRSHQLTSLEKVSVHDTAKNHLTLLVRSLD